MPKRSYVERITQRDEGRLVTDPQGGTWKIQRVLKKTVNGRRQWRVGLKHTERRGTYTEENADSIVHGAWRWAEDDPGRPSKSKRSKGSSSSAQYDDEGRRLCDACGEPIFFIEAHGTGKAMPVDHEGIAARQIVEERDSLHGVTMMTRGGHVLRGAMDLQRAAEQNLTVYRSHFASCPNADRFR